MRIGMVVCASSITTLPTNSARHLHRSRGRGVWWLICGTRAGHKRQLGRHARGTLHLSFLPSRSLRWRPFLPTTTCADVRDTGSRAHRRRGSGSRMSGLGVFLLEEIECVCMYVRGMCEDAMVEGGSEDTKRRTSTRTCVFIRHTTTASDMDTHEAGNRTGSTGQRKSL